MISSKKRIVILGAGYAGLTAAIDLEKLLKQNDSFRITPVDRYDYHQLKTEIHVAAGRASPEEVMIPISKLIRKRDIEFVQAEIMRARRQL